LEILVIRGCDILKKTMGIVGLTMLGTAGLTAYVLMNKSTKRNADKLINSMLDEANSMVKDIK